MLQARWTVRARCSQKADIRRYSNARGEGKVRVSQLAGATHPGLRPDDLQAACLHMLVYLIDATCLLRLADLPSGAGVQL